MADNNYIEKLRKKAATRKSVTPRESGLIESSNPQNVDTEEVVSSSDLPETLLEHNEILEYKRFSLYFEQSLGEQIRDFTHQQPGITKDTFLEACYLLVKDDATLLEKAIELAADRKSLRDRSTNIKKAQKWSQKIQ